VSHFTIIAFIQVSYSSSDEWACQFLFFISVSAFISTVSELKHDDILRDFFPSNIISRCMPFVFGQPSQGAVGESEYVDDSIEEDNEFEEPEIHGISLVISNF
jgi:hypothetical protein